MNRLTLIRSAPDAVSQKLTLFIVGKATSRTPSCKRHDEVHQADDERHGHEEDHDRAVRGEDLVVMLGRQIALRRSDRHRLLRPHHDRVGKAAHQHQQRSTMYMMPMFL